MILFWSGDSASLDGVGDWAVGDLQAFLFSSTPFSASELEKKEKRFTFDIHREVDRKTMSRLAFWRVEWSSIPTDRLRSTWTAVPLPNLHSNPSQQASAGKYPTLPGPAGSQVCSQWALSCPTEPWRLGGPPRILTHVPSARCEPSCWEPPRPLFALLLCHLSPFVVVA